MKLSRFVVVLFAFGWLAACGSETLTTPPEISSPTREELAVTAAPLPASAPITTSASATVWDHGAVTVKGPWEGFVCYFWDGPHEQDPAAPNAPVSVESGKTLQVPFPSIKQDSPEHCKVQVDVGTSCAKSSIIPGMLAHGYVTVGECEKECVPGADVISTTEDEGDWIDGSCPDTVAPLCSCGYEHRLITTTTTTTNECNAKSSTSVRCEQRKKKPCPQPTPTPNPGGICHVSNKGRPGGDWNLQVSFKKHGTGHELHLNEEKFCPADFKVKSRRDCTKRNAYRQLRKQNYCLSD